MKNITQGIKIIAFLFVLAFSNNIYTQVGLSEDLTVSGISFRGAKRPNVDSNDGAEIRLEYRIRNYDSTQTATNLQIVKNLQAVANSNGVMLTGIDSINSTNGHLTVNSSFDGAGNQNVISSGSLAPGQEEAIIIVFRVKPRKGGLEDSPIIFPTIVDSSTLTGLIGTSSFNDVSQTGVIPDANGDGDPSNDGVSSEVSFDYYVALGGTKYSNVGSEVPQTDGSYNVRFLWRVGNNGNANAYNVQFVEDLDVFLPSPATYTLTSVTTSSPICAGKLNPGFDGSSDKNVMASNFTMPGGTGCDIYFNLNVFPNGVGPWVYNQITHSSEISYADTSSSFSGVNRKVTSYAAAPAGPAEHYVPYLLANPIPVGFALNIQSQTGTAGNYTVVYRVTAENIGSTQATNVYYALVVNPARRILDKGSATESISISNISVVSGSVNLNPSYSGDDSTPGANGHAFAPQGSNPTFELFNGETFDPGEKVEIDITVNYQNIHDCYVQQLSAVGFSDVGGVVEVRDDSVNGLNVDPDADGRPEDNSSYTILNLPCNNPGTIPIGEIKLFKNAAGRAESSVTNPYKVRQSDVFEYFLFAQLPSGYRGITQNFTITDVIPAELEILSVQGIGGQAPGFSSTVSGNQVTINFAYQNANLSTNTFNNVTYFQEGSHPGLGARITVRVKETSPSTLLIPNSATLTTNGNSIDSADGTRLTNQGNLSLIRDSSPSPTYIFIEETIDLQKTISAGTASLSPGALVTNQIAATNVYRQDVRNAIIDDSLNSTQTYVPESIKLDGVAMTDAEDGDLCYYRASENRVHCNVGVGASSVTGGVLRRNSTVILEFQATANVFNLGDKVTNTAEARGVGAFDSTTAEIEFTGIAPLIGPNGNPSAVGPTDNNDDFTQRSILGDIGVEFGNNLPNSKMYVFTNSVNNPATTTQSFSVYPQSIPNGYTVECSLDRITFVPCSSTNPFDLGSFSANETKQIYTRVTVPAGTPLLQGNSIVLESFLNTYRGLTNRTINQLYVGVIEFKKTFRVINNTGNGNPTDAVPGAIIEYSISYKNVSEQIVGGTGNSLFVASNIQIIEDGNETPNNWGTTTTQVVGSAIDSNGGTISGDVAGSSLLIDTIPSLAPGQSGTFTFQRLINKSP